MEPAKEEKAAPADSADMNTVETPQERDTFLEEEEPETAVETSGRELTSVKENAAALTPNDSETKPEKVDTMRSADDAPLTSDISGRNQTGSIADEPSKSDMSERNQMQTAVEVPSRTNLDETNTNPTANDEPSETITPEEKPEEVMTVNVNQIEKAKVSNTGNSEGGFFTHEYKFPPTDYLRPGSDKISVDADELLENKQKIKQTLLDFGIPITSIEATVGPTVTLYEIRPDTGVKIAKIRNLVDDLALSLAANGVRIIAPIPGKGTVGIEVANKEAQTVSMRTIIQSKVYQNNKYKLPVALGSTISNEVYIADLAKMPHLLVAGATGQGKSVGLNAIVTSLLYAKRPEELKFVFLDPKRV